VVLDQHGAKLATAPGEVSHGVRLLGRTAEERLIGIVMAHEPHLAGRDPGAFYRKLDHKPDPVLVFASAVAGVEGQIAETVKDGPAAVELDRQRIMRTVADDDVGACLDCRMGAISLI